MHIIHIEPLAPRKPQEGQACNGCGVCCLAEPCPVGVVLFRHRRGACEALVWQVGERQYRCGAIADPHSVVAMAVPQWLALVRPALVRVLQWGAPRWVASGVGCDSSLEPVPSDPFMGTETNEQRDNDST